MHKYLIFLSIIARFRKNLCNFAPAFSIECKTYCSITSQSPPEKKERTYIIWAAPLRAQISHICMWLVASREVCGESLRLLR